MKVKLTEALPRWEDLPIEALEVCSRLGRAGPVINPTRREIKGTAYDEEGSYGVYFDADQLRGFATGLIAVADWLDRRALLSPEATASSKEEGE